MIFSATREAAFVHSIISAGVAFQVTKACSAGDLLEECGCANTSELVGTVFAKSH